VLFEVSIHLSSILKEFGRLGLKSGIFGEQMMCFSEG
jgi:hypothetical protein